MEMVPTFSSVQNQNKLSHQVLNNIKEAIVRGKLKPGDKMPGLAEMATEMGVGISSVREAIKMLEALEILESKQGKGIYVCDGLRPSAINPLSLQLILIQPCVEALTQFREVYETAFTMLAMSNAEDADLEEMEKIVIELEKKTKIQEADSQDEMLFHSCVLHCTHNPYVIRTGEAMLEVFLSTIPTCGGMADDSGIARDHRKIYESLKNRDKVELQKVLKKSFDGWKIRLSGQEFHEQKYGVD